MLNFLPGNPPILPWRQFPSLWEQAGAHNPWTRASICTRLLSQPPPGPEWNNPCRAFLIFRSYVKAVCYPKNRTKPDWCHSKGRVGSGGGFSKNGLHLLRKVFEASRLKGTDYITESHLTVVYHCHYDKLYKTVVP